MHPTEITLVILLAGLATGIALGLIEVPPVFLHSSVMQAFLLVMTLVFFAYSPVVGIAAVALFAILMFKRNVQKTTQYTIALEHAKEARKEQEYQPIPMAAVRQPRQYQVNEPSPSSIEHYASPQEIGTYPLQEVQPAMPTTLTAAYRPSEDMGENTFVRSGPNMDQKMQSFAY